MPKPKPPLRQIRAATPYATQEAFAGFLGVPLAVLQAAESGKARLTAGLAGRIRELTGADDRELLRGADGEARTIDGRRYAAGDFLAWQGSGRQATERERNRAARELREETWEHYLAAAVPGRPGAPLSPADLAAVEDWMAPWQTCDFATAPAAGWKQLPDVTRRLTGWSPGLPVSRRARLTLAVQSVPAWNPDGMPPGLAAANADLFPPCYFTLGAGTGGCRAAAAFWQLLCREHAIDRESGQPERESPTGSWRGFFRDRGGRCEPHAVFAGAEAPELPGFSRGLFAPDSILTGPPGEGLAERAMEFLEAHSRDAGSPAGILLFSSLEGGTACALGPLLLARLRARFPQVPILAIGVLPLAGISPVVAAPWHIALALQAIRRHASAALLFCNESLLQRAERSWQLRSPGYAEANLLIAEGVGSLTAPLRFGGTDTPPVDLAALLESFAAPHPGGIPVFTGQCWPLASLADRRLKSLTLPWLAERALKTARAARLSDECGIAAFLRVRLQPGSPWLVGNEPPVLTLTGRTVPGIHESASVFAWSPDLRKTLRRLARQAAEVWTAENAGSLCAELGVTEEELRTAVREMAAMPEIRDQPARLTGRRGLDGVEDGGGLSAGPVGQFFE